ncbi:amino acid permease [Colletotrichum gloeosporioides Cg-14]|uniref:Amino acid permease n=1 Tax=Colletotrichum gloeosporioides (strain Cg-14) TaxID=1237896 RepID=T0MDI1_COLGC|nr:amino acid permease [Colletotrichum gloeosporioides Cg-14]
MEGKEKYDAASDSAPVPDVDGGQDVSVSDAEGGIKRDLSSRHINMIAIAGMIGTGLFLSSGSVIATAGPAGALLAYIVMGFVTAGVSYTTGEITSFMPATGGFIRHATKFVEPALGAATGWNFWYTMAISVPAEISAAATLVQFWNTSVNPAVWITVFLLFIIVVNFAGVRLYGETEVVFASLKIMTIIGLIIGGLVISLGGGPNRERLGFRYWQDPGAFNSYIVPGSAGGFLAFWKVLLSAAFSYGNIQVVAISGSETRHPRKIIPAATRKTFFRVFVFYVLSILVVGMISVQRPCSECLNWHGSAIPIRHRLHSLCGSACVFIASRTLYGLSCDGHAPRILQRCNRFGTPYVAVALTCVLFPLVYLNVGNNTSVVFGWFVNITTVAGLIGWIVIEFTYLRFYAGLKAQGYSRKDLPYRSPGQPYVSWITLVAVVLVVFFSGFDVFTTGNFTASGFLTCYLNVFIFAALYVFFKFYLKSRVISPSQMDFETEFASIRREKAESEVFDTRETGLKSSFRKLIHSV